MKWASMCIFINNCGHTIALNLFSTDIEITKQQKYAYNSIVCYSNEVDFPAASLSRSISRSPYVSVFIWFFVFIFLHWLLKRLLWNENVLARSWKLAMKIEIERERGRWRKWPTENKVEKNFGKPIVKFPCEYFYRNKYWFREWKKNTYFLNVLDVRLHLHCLVIFSNGSQIAAICDEQNPLKKVSTFFVCVHVWLYLQ